MIISFPYPRSPLPLYTTLPAALAKTAWPDCPPIATPLGLGPSLKVCRSLPRAGQTQVRPYSPAATTEPALVSGEAIVDVASGTAGAGFAGIAEPGEEAAE